MREGRPHGPDEHRLIHDGNQWRAPHRQHNHRRTHGRFRTETAGGDVKRQGWNGPVLRQDREDAVVLRPRPGHEAPSHFGLQHQHHPINQMVGVQELEQQRRRNRVGQIGDHHRPVGHRVVGKRQRVAEPKLQIIDSCQRGLQGFAQRAIQFDRDDMPGLFAQGASQNPTTRADLQHRVLAPKRGGGHNFPDNVVIDEEMLAETFLGTRRERHHGQAGPDAGPACRASLMSARIAVR